MQSELDSEKANKQTHKNHSEHILYYTVNITITNNT